MLCEISESVGLDGLLEEVSGDGLELLDGGHELEYYY